MAVVTHDIITLFYLQTPAFSSTVPAVATTAFPRAGRVSRYMVLAQGPVCGDHSSCQVSSGDLCSATARARTQSLLQRPGVSWQMACLNVNVTQNHAGPTRSSVVNGSARSNPFQNTRGTACSSLAKQLPKGSFFSLEEQVCIYLISISIGRYPGLDPPILSVSLL